MTISAVQSVTTKPIQRRLTAPVKQMEAFSGPPSLPAMESSVRFGGRGSLWATLLIAGLGLGVAGTPPNPQAVQAQPVPVLPQPKEVEEIKAKPKEEVSASKKTLDEIAAFHNDNKLGSGFTIEKAKKITPLVRQHIKLLQDPSSYVTFADLEQGANLAISNVYFQPTMVDQAIKEGQKDHIMAVLEWEGALIERAGVTGDDVTKRNSLRERLYGDLMWYSCYSDSSGAWDKAASEYGKQAIGGPGSYQKCYVDKVISNMPGNNVAKRFFTTLQKDAETAITELGNEKAMANPKRGEWLRAAYVGIPVLTQVSNDTSSTPKIPAEDQKKLKDWLFKQAHPTLVKVAHKGLVTPNLRVPERQLLVGLIAQGVGYEKQTDVLQRQVAVWGYDPLNALMAYPNNMADYTAEDRKVRFNQKRYTVEMPKDARDEKKGFDKVAVLPFSSIYLDANRVMYGNDQKVSSAYQGFDWSKNDPRLTRYTQVTMVSVHLGALRDLSNRDDVPSEFIGTGLIQFKQSVDEGYYKRNVGVSPITWGEHAGLLLSVMGGKRHDVSDADFVKTKAAIYAPFMPGGTENKPLFGKDAFYQYRPGAFESYQTWVTECGVASAIVRKDVLKANDKLKGDDLDDAVEKALGEKSRDGKFIEQVQKEARLMTPRGVAEEMLSAEIAKALSLKGSELDQAVTIELNKRFNPRSKDYDKEFAGKVDREVATRLKAAEMDKFVPENVTQARLGFIQTVLAYMSPQVPPAAVDAALETWGLRPEEIAKARKEPRPKYLQ